MQNYKKYLNITVFMALMFRLWPNFCESPNFIKMQYSTIWVPFN